MNTKRAYQKRPIRDRFLAVKDWVYTLAGSALVALAFILFFIPNHIAPGGISGLATEINALTGFPVGVTIAVINIPLMLLGWRLRGAGFMIRTLVSTLLLSVLIDMIQFPAAVYELFSDDLLLSTVYGGVLMGVGTGLIILGDATSGGSDLAAILINYWCKSIDVPKALFAIDALVVLLAAFVFAPKMALYALMACFINARVLDFMQTGSRAAKAFYIISQQRDAIAHRLIHELQRGVTVLQASGGFSRRKHNVLLCVVNFNQITQVKHIVQQEDPDAFVILSDVKEVLGEGFTLPVRQTPAPGLAAHDAQSDSE